MNITPVVLEGRWVRLEPLERRHVAPMCEVGIDPRLWEWVPSQVAGREDMERYVDLALTQAAEGVALPFAIVARKEGKVVGSTRFGSIERMHRRVEIGWTWVAVAWQRTAINTEAKYLMLRHAFEALGCQRVELKTDALNERSRNAILRIGAKQEGILRSHMVTSGGRIRDSVIFSIIKSEWPEVRGRLEVQLSARDAVPASGQLGGLDNGGRMYYI